VRVDNKTSEQIRVKFEQTWLARYPWPRNCIHDNGSEFTGWEFQQLLEALGIKDVPTTSHNPTANAICERMHQTVGNILRTILQTDPPHTVTEARALVDSALATAMHAMSASISTTLGGSPGSLVFSRDMFLNIPLIADWHLIVQR
jgi:transposase InsO family protein